MKRVKVGNNENGNVKIVEVGKHRKWQCKKSESRKQQDVTHMEWKQGNKLNDTHSESRERNEMTKRQGKQRKKGYDKHKVKEGKHIK